MILEQFIVIGKWLFEVLHELGKDVRKSNTVSDWVERLFVNVS